MNRSATLLAAALCGAALGATAIHGQGRGGEWTTSGFDAQRTGSIRADPRISVDTMRKPGAFGAFRFLWKLKLETEPGAADTLTEPILLDRIIGFRGFKSIAFVGAGSETVHAVDIDLAVPLWKYHINYSASPPPVKGASPGCPGGLTAAISRPTPIALQPAGRGAGAARGAAAGGGVGEPGRGAATLGAGRARGATAAPGSAPGGAAPAQPTAVPGSAAAAAGLIPGGLPGGARAGGAAAGAAGGFVPGGDAAYVVGSDGYLHALNVQNGWEMMTPTLFLPANTRAAGLLVATTGDGGAVGYAATTHGCGSQPDGVWAMDLASQQKTVTGFPVKGAAIAGAAGPALGRDGTVYVSTAAGTSPMSSAIMGLEARTLKLKGSVVVPGGGFTSSPVLFAGEDRELLVASGAGKLFLFDTGFLAKGPIAISASYAPADGDAVTVATWQDAAGVRWVAAPSERGMVAMKITQDAGTPAFVAGWTSRVIVAPVSPLVVNGVLFVASMGTRGAPGVLYALDASTGLELWNSGKAVAGAVRGGLSAGQGNVYVPGADGTLYAFGFAIEK